jgi:hypothetical protein
MFPTTTKHTDAAKLIQTDAPIPKPVAHVTAAEMFPITIASLEPKNRTNDENTQTIDIEKDTEKRSVRILFAHASRPVPTDSSPVVYVGRSPWVPEKFIGSIWEKDLGNNFVVGRDGAAGECAAKFGVQLTERLAAKHEKTRDAMNRIAKTALDKGSVTLVCHCHGVNACHSHEIGKTLASALEKMGHKVDLPQIRQRENKTIKSPSGHKSAGTPELLPPPKGSPKSGPPVEQDREF